jgi:hypothetical protein
MNLAATGLILDLAGVLVLASDILPTHRLDRARYLLDDVRAFMKANGLASAEPPRREVSRWDSSYRRDPPTDGLLRAMKLLRIKPTEPFDPVKYEAEATEALNVATVRDAYRFRAPLSLGLLLIVVGFALQLFAAIRA